MNKIPLFKATSTEKDIQSVSSVIRRKTYWAVGPEVILFEEKLANYLGVKYCIVFNSGTSAGHALMEAFQVRGKEVIVPSFSFIATSNVVIMAGGIPIFTDIESETLGLSPESVKSKINSRTIAVMPMHYAGGSCKINELDEICKAKGISLIEDSAESLGCKLNNKMVGTIGDASWFSFAQNKIISTGEGGAIATDNKEIYECCKLIRSHGRDEKTDYFTSSEAFDYISLGYNFRMASMNAALGISQLENIEDHISRRIKISNKYNDFFHSNGAFEIIQGQKNSRHVYQIYSVLIKNSIHRDALISYLTKKGISSKVYFSPIHETSYYKHHFPQNEDLETTLDISKRIISLPIYPDLEEKDIERVISTIEDFTKNT